MLGLATPKTPTPPPPFLQISGSTTALWIIIYENIWWTRATKFTNIWTYIFFLHTYVTLSKNVTSFLYTYYMYNRRVSVYIVCEQKKWHSNRLAAVVSFLEILQVSNWTDVMWSLESDPYKNDTQIQCWNNVGQASQTPAHHWFNIGSVVSCLPGCLLVSDTWIHIYYLPIVSDTQQTPDVHPMLGWCWASVVDGGPTSTQHWGNVTCTDRRQLPAQALSPCWLNVVPALQTVFQHLTNIDSLSRVCWAVLLTWLSAWYAHLPGSKSWHSGVGLRPQE